MKRKILEYESLPEFDDGIKNMDDYSKGKVDATLEQAYLWYERMGKFAEEQALLFVGKTNWKYFASTGKWISPHHKKQLTTPELINEFLQQENKEK